MSQSCGLLIHYARHLREHCRHLVNSVRQIWFQNSHRMMSVSFAVHEILLIRQHCLHLEKKAARRSWKKKQRGSSWTGVIVSISLRCWKKKADFRGQRSVCACSMSWISMEPIWSQRKVLSWSYLRSISRLLSARKSRSCTWWRCWWSILVQSNRGTAYSLWLPGRRTLSMTLCSLTIFGQGAEGRTTDMYILRNCPSRMRTCSFY